MARLRFVVPALALVAYAVALVQVQRLELDGPPTLWLELGGGIPAVLYLPGERESFWPPPPPAPVGERPPAVLLVHGYSGDNPIMSGLARALTRAGYAVLTGVALEVLYFPTRIAVTALAPTFVVLELVFGAYYATSRNLPAAVLFECLWLGWVLAVSLPVSI